MLVACEWWTDAAKSARLAPRARCATCTTNMGHRLARGMRACERVVDRPTLKKALAPPIGRRRLRSAPPPRPTHPKRKMPMLRERTQSTNHAVGFAACADPCCNQPLCAPSEPELDADSEELAAAAERDMMAAKAMQDFGQLCDVLRDLHDPMLVGQKKKPNDASFNDDVALLADHWRRASSSKENAPKMEKLTRRQRNRTLVLRKGAIRVRSPRPTRAAAPARRRAPPALPLRRSTSSEVGRARRGPRPCCPWDVLASIVHLLLRVCASAFRSCTVAGCCCCMLHAACCMCMQPRQLPVQMYRCCRRHRCGCFVSTRVAYSSAHQLLI